MTTPAPTLDSAWRARLDEEAARQLAALKVHLDAQNQTGLFDQLNQYHENEDDRVADLASETALAIHRHELLSLADVIAAKQRLEQGTYGVCIDCDACIPAARLHVYPTAKRCIECQRQTEARRSQGSSSL